MTELHSLMAAGLTEMIDAAGATTASINGEIVSGIYTSGERSGDLGLGGLVTPSPAEFVYPASAASAPALLKTIIVAGQPRRVLSYQEDGGLISVTLGDPDDVRK